jgi:hypothetical protein
MQMFLRKAGQKNALAMQVENPCHLAASDRHACRERHLFIRQQTAVINAIRAHLAEFGIVAPVGRKGVEALLDVVANPTDKRFL